MTHAATATQPVPAPATTALTASPFLSEADAARYINMSIFFLRQARVQGRGPAFLRFGRAIRYRLSDLEAWLAGRTVRVA